LRTKCDTRSAPKATNALRTLIDRLAADGNKTTTITRSLNHIKAVVSAAIREAELAKTSSFAALQITNEGEDSDAASVVGCRIS
jgi:hypothetical protein